MLIENPDGSKKEFVDNKLFLVMSTESAKKDISGVVVTCHNYGKFLRRCIDSLLLQTKPFDKIVVVNDSSTDDTEVICKSYGTRIEYIACSLKDFNKARKLGVERLYGFKYLMLFDADNFASKELHERLFNTLESDVTLAVAYPKINYYTSGVLVGMLSQQFDYDLLRKRNYVDICALIRIQAYNQVYGLKEGFNLSDWHLWMRITNFGWGMKLNQSAILNYEVHDSNMHKTVSDGFGENVKVLVDTLRVTVITLFSGREWNVERYCNALSKLQFPKDNIFIIAIDNSGEESFNTLLSYSLQGCGINYTIIKDSSRINDVSPDEFADSKKHRVSEPRKMQEHLARLYARADQFVPASTDLVFSVEDDIIIPEDCLKQFCYAFMRYQDVSVFVGCVQSRFDSRLIATTGSWNDIKNINKIHSVPDKVTDIMASGMMLTIFRMDTWKKIVFLDRPFDYGQMPWYDYAIHYQVNLNGGRIALLNTVVGIHWTKNGYGLLPDNKTITDEDREIRTRIEVQSRLSLHGSKQGSNERSSLPIQNSQESLSRNSIPNCNDG